MTNPFFDAPILNSPYECPTRHWELDKSGQPTQKTLEFRRKADLITPIPAPRKRKGLTAQQEMDLKAHHLDTEKQKFEHTRLINEVREQVDRWRQYAQREDWRVTPETARLLHHWRHHPFSGVRPFFCQIEAVETVIWLTEVAPKLGETGRKFLRHLENANREANPELVRLALKLATGAGKTTVMAMIIAWQTVNAVRKPDSKLYTRGFLVVAPGITIRDRLRVLLPNDSESYYRKRELVPNDMLRDLGRAEIVITNYHAFKLREKMSLSKGGRNLLEGRRGTLSTLETEGQMLQRVMPQLMGMKNILVINDEAHHCYREKVDLDELEGLKGDARKEAERNNEAARLWISGIEAVKRKLRIQRVLDLSATPFFLRGSGYPEGTIFHWTMSDFSLMDAIECGIVKLPRVPVADNIPGHKVPMFRNLWEHIKKDMPKKGRGKAEGLEPHKLPAPLETALLALYGHYEKVFHAWREAKMGVDPCFIVVCNNTSTSKLVYDYISGFFRKKADGTEQLEQGRLELFRNYDEHGQARPRPYTLLIDSNQLESGDALDKNFRDMAATEIEQYRREMLERGEGREKAENLTDADLLREVMNTVGKKDRLGETVRCVVSVSMLTEGWDANTVTHVLGVRAFGTQLLCEQVVGRALRRQSYELNDDKIFNVEYADVLGIPFDFTAQPVPVKPIRPAETINVKAVRPDRDALEIRFPRVAGYRVEMPQQSITAEFNEDSTFRLTPGLIGATETQNSGIIGEHVDLNLKFTADVRPSQVLYELTAYFLQHHWTDDDNQPKLTDFGKIKRICRQWLENHLVCVETTFPAQLKYKNIAEIACKRILDAINRSRQDKGYVKALLDPYNPVGSTRHVSFNTSKQERWQTASDKCHLNWAILDSDWEGEFCRIVENHPKVKAYVKNRNMGFEVPYRFGGETRIYVPDFILLVDDGREDPLHLVIEVKGYRKEDAKEKKATMETYWVPGVNQLEKFGRWAFAELREVWSMGPDLEAKIRNELDSIMVDSIRREYSPTQALDTQVDRG